MGFLFCPQVWPVVYEGTLGKSSTVCSVIVPVDRIWPRVDNAMILCHGLLQQDEDACYGEVETYVFYLPTMYGNNLPCFCVQIDAVFIRIVFPHHIQR